MQHHVGHDIYYTDYSPPLVFGGQLLTLSFLATTSQQVLRDGCLPNAMLAFHMFPLAVQFSKNGRAVQHHYLVQPFYAGMYQYITSVFLRLYLRLGTSTWRMYCTLRPVND